MLLTKRHFGWIVGGTAILAFVFIAIGRREKENTGLDSFAQCLAERGAVMYGAEWCPHCQNEKRAFGSSFRYVNYVECPDDPKRCIAAGIEGYPTWTFPDGRRFEGEQGIERLSIESGCAIENPPSGE
ncbi:hypothetical protein C4587_02295 [Candidatus Parcubacteria bacterium]|nr:MAG: hypothetical protein C4587_02295 [Candidatus Parcubacteria bacterium]